MKTKVYVFLQLKTNKKQNEYLKNYPKTKTLNTYYHENKNIKQNTDNLVSVVFRTTYYSMDILLKPYSRCGLKPYSGAKGNEANH